MRAYDLAEATLGSAMDFDVAASSGAMEAIVVLSSVLVAAFVVGLCVKYKTRKDPAFTGTEGKIRINSASSDIEAAATRNNLQNHHSLTPPSPPHPSSPFQHQRTPSRTGDRKLPEIPPPPQQALDQQDSQSNLYATVDDSRLYPGVAGAAGADRAALASAVSSNYHPYAKVKKKTKKVEHPYATVKKSPSSGAGAATASSSSSSPSANKKDSSDDDDDDEDDEDEDDDEEVDGLRLLRPVGSVSRENRTGSGRSDDLNASVHSVIGNRQTTPLPPEPLAAQAAQQPGHHLHQQQQQQHFSGDSQDSSKGYTSITVREPVRHIHLPPAAARGGRGDATYATLSETSDEMYAAIEDPTYIPTGTSQSNSDTYAVIDLPPEEMDGARGAVVSMNPGESSYLHHHHTYSKVTITYISRISQRCILVRSFYSERS